MSTEKHKEFIERNKYLKDEWGRNNATELDDRYECSLQLIHDLAIGYDGYKSEEDLKELIDELREIAKYTLSYA